MFVYDIEICTKIKIIKIYYTVYPYTKQKFEKSNKHNRIITIKLYN